MVQETAIAMARHLPEYRYDPEVCRFKTWLLNQTSWRIKNQLRKRQQAGVQASAWPQPAAFPGTLKRELQRDETCTDTINRVPDPGATDLDALFEKEWRKNLFAAALERVKEKFSLKQFQIFDLLVVKEWPAAEVAKSLGVSLANVYVTRHRVSAVLKKEMTRLKRKLEKGV